MIKKLAQMLVILSIFMQKYLTIFRCLNLKFHYQNCSNTCLFSNAECPCNTNNTIDGSNFCDRETGFCDITPRCKSQFEGETCEQCNATRTFGNYPNCKSK